MAYEFLTGLAISFGAAYLASEAMLAMPVSVGIYRFRKALREKIITPEYALETLKFERNGWSFMPIASRVMSREIRRIENLYKV